MHTDWLKKEGHNQIEMHGQVEDELSEKQKQNMGIDNIDCPGKPVLQAAIAHAKVDSEHCEASFDLTELPKLRKQRS